MAGPRAKTGGARKRAACEDGRPYAATATFSRSSGVTSASQASIRSSVSMPCVRWSITNPTKRPSTIAAE